MTPRLAIALVAATSLLGLGQARADVVEAQSTTLLQARQETRGDGKTYAVVPAYELISISAHGIKTSFTDSLELVLSTWGAVNLGSLDSGQAWWNGYTNTGRVSGDLDLAFVKAELARRAVMVQLGRMMVSQGNSRMVQMDGLSLRLRLPAGFAVAGYVGSPVATRFGTRVGDYTENPAHGDVTAGGRLSWTHPRLLEIGASFAQDWDRGVTSRQDLAGDLRLTPVASLTMAGYLDYALSDSAVAEANGSVLWLASRKVQVSLDYRYLVPSLLLARDSILSVFSDTARNDIGGNLHLSLVPALSLDLGGAVLLLDGGDTGGRGNARATWQPGKGASVGAEVSYVTTANGSDLASRNSFVGFRVFGRKELGRFLGTLDLQDYLFDKSVNGQTNSFLGTASLGYLIGSGWSATVAGSGAVTPYFSSRFDVLAKLAYNMTYVVREVRP
jgi:hypothetical protein